MSGCGNTTYTYLFMEGDIFKVLKCHFSKKVICVMLQLQHSFREICIFAGVFCVCIFVAAAGGFRKLYIYKFFVIFMESICKN